MLFCVHRAMAAAVNSSAPVKGYFTQKIHELRAQEKRKLDDYQRLEAQPTLPTASLDPARQYHTPSASEFSFSIVCVLSVRIALS